METVRTEIPLFKDNTDKLTPQKRDMAQAEKAYMKLHIIQK